MRFTCVHKCSPRRQSPLPPQAHGHAPRVAPLETVGSCMQVLTTAPGDAWPSDGHAPRVAVWGTVGSCSCPLPIPRLYPRLWTGVGALRTWRRAVPVWGLEWCRACGDCGRAPLVVVRRRRRAAASLLSRRRTPLGRGAETPGECMTCSVTVRAMSDVAGLRRGRHATLPRRRARRPGPPAGRSGVHRPSTELVLADSAFTTRESGFITGPSPCDKNGP